MNGYRGERRGGGRGFLSYSCLFSGEGCSAGAVMKAGCPGGAGALPGAVRGARAGGSVGPATGTQPGREGQRSP